ncbi:MAG TPA: hypothetical protein PL152_01055 [Steroidobacteraceae bacterium]|nr:hypothetical protein [Steroidobacteraceae bacterium]HQR47888.1 hypothetical protein [Steroidobacteraceae bacterium]
MNHTADTIPVLTDLIEDDALAGVPGTGLTATFLGEIEAHLSAAIHDYADELVHNACRELEAMLLEQVSDRLRTQLPTLIAGIIEEHFRGPGSAG